MQNSSITYNTGWLANGITWSNRDTTPFRFAVASFSQEYKNSIDIVQKHEEELVCRATWTHCYPPTKLMFSPAKTGSDILITTADYLRVWEVVETPEGSGMKEKEMTENEEGSHAEPGDNGDKDKSGDNNNNNKESREKEKEKEDTHNNNNNSNASGAAAAGNTEDSQKSQLLAKKKLTVNSEVRMKKVFDFGKPNDFCSPVTSCDWNADDPAVVGTCSIDTTVTIWNIAEEKHTMQLIAHDKDVYDIAFAKGTHTFASCGADGSVRLFDLREMEHCTVVYETQQYTPLLRVAWNKHDQTYLSTFGIHDKEVIIIDIRMPSMPVGSLKDGHKGPINSVNWAPHSSHHMCSAGEDGAANIWNLTDFSNNLAPSRFLTYDAPAPINSISWSAQHDKYIAIATGKQAQVLRI